MKDYIVRFNFLFDDSCDTTGYIVYLPSNLSLEDFRTILKNIHNYLCCDDEEDIYGINGRTAETLLAYVSEKYGIKYKQLAYDLEMDFD